MTMSNAYVAWKSWSSRMMRITLGSEWHMNKAEMVFLYLFHSSGLAHLDWASDIPFTGPGPGGAAIGGNSMVCLGNFADIE